jgi:hypothetical protein
MFLGIMLLMGLVSAAVLYIGIRLIRKRINKKSQAPFD